MFIAPPIKILIYQHYYLTEPIRKGEPTEFKKTMLNFAQKIGKIYMESEDEYEEKSNPNYPEESYEAFILRMIKQKKLKIEKVLDLK